MFYVYELRYPDGTPFYVGKGSGNRCNGHFYKSNITNPLKKNVINKIRSNNQEPLVVIVFDNLQEHIAFETECFLIAHYGRRDNNTGILTNMTDGGEGCSGKVISDTTRKKISDTKKKNPTRYWLGKKRSQETIDKLKTKNPTRYWAGKSIPEEAKRNMSKAKDSIKTPVIQIMDDGTEIKYESLSEAYKKTGISNGSIRYVCMGKRNHAGGFKWRYA